MSYFINRYSIIGTKTVWYEVWENAGCDFTSSQFKNIYTHGTIRSEHDKDGNTQWYGKLTTKEIPMVIQNLPYGPIRTKEVNTWYNKLKDLSVIIILDAYPHLLNKCQIFDGNICEQLDSNCLRVSEWLQVTE